MKILITGGYGFIGSSVVRHILTYSNHGVINIDSLTFAQDIAKAFITILPSLDSKKKLQGCCIITAIHSVRGMNLPRRFFQRQKT